MSTEAPARAAQAQAAPETLWRTVVRKLTTNPSTLPTLAALVIFIGMLIFGEISYGRIFQYSTISNLFINNAHIIIIAAGMTAVIITGGIDLSVGAIVALSAVAGVLLANSGLNPWVAVLVMILIGSTFGLFSGVLIQYFNVQPFIATLSAMFLARGLAAILSTDAEKLDPESPIRLLGAKIKLIDGPKVNDLEVTAGVIIAFVVVVAVFFLMHRTRLGRTAYAIGGSEQSAILMGLPVNRTKLWLYTISGTLSGLASVVYTSRIGVGQNIVGDGWEMQAIAATVIGGTLLTGGAGFVLGAVVGSLVLGLMNVLITKDGAVPPEWTTIIIGGTLLLFVLLQRGVMAIRRR